MQLYPDGIDGGELARIIQELAVRDSDDSCDDAMPPPAADIPTVEEDRVLDGVEFATLESTPQDLGGADEFEPEEQ